MSSSASVNNSDGTHATKPYHQSPIRSRIRPPRLYMYFDAMARHGSIRSAAEALHIASSALNRRLLDLEQDVGMALFDRLPTGIRLTAAGTVFAAHVRRTLSDAEQAGDRIDELHGAMRGHVAVGSAESAAVGFLPQVMATLQAEHPGIRFTLTVGTPSAMSADLLAGRVDLIITHQDPDHPDVAVLAAAQKPFCALMRPGHPLAARTQLFINECNNFPVVLADERMAARALVEATLAINGLSLQPALVTNLFETMKHYVRRTDAVSFQFHFGPLVDPSPGGLVAVPLADPRLAEAQLMLAVLRGRVLPAGVAAMCDRLRALLGDPATL